MSRGSTIGVEPAMRYLSAMQSRAGFLSILFLAAWSVAARAEDAPPSIETEDGDNFLVIPGIGKIPMPPGTRVFGPRNDGGVGPGLAPRRQGPQAVAPQPPKTQEQREADELGRLFARLGAAEDEREARTIETSLQRHWARSGSETTDLLCQRAAVAEQTGSAQLARALMDYVTVLSPYWAEGFVRRARVRAMQNDATGALADMETAVRLDPKRFDALQALGALSEQTGDKKKALEAYRKSLAISPQQESLRKQEERLKLDVEGRDI